MLAVEAATVARWAMVPLPRPQILFGFDEEQADAGSAAPPVLR